MAIRINGITGIDMGNTPVSNVKNPELAQDVVTKEYLEGGIYGAYGVRYDQENDIITPLGSRNRTLIQDKMKRCVLNANGTVNYYLDAHNSALKDDSTGVGVASVLDGTDGNVMVQVPKFYIKHTLINNIHEWWVSLFPKEGYSVHPWFLEGGVEAQFKYYRAYTCTLKNGKLMSISGSTPTRSQTRATFRTQAQANGAGWSICSWNAVNAIQILFLTEYCTFNSQSVLGTGNHLGNDYGMITGQSNSLGNFSSTAGISDKVMSYRGIENFYSDTWEFIDGINVQDYKVFLNQNPSTFADDVFTGNYINSGVTVPVASANYVKKISSNFLPTAIGGSSSTYITDGFWSTSGNRVAFFGGDAYYGLLDGAFCLALNSLSSYLHVSVGSGLSF